ncbi:N-terminal phage integrase SAM-like domain-containing protein, partial [Oenococcus oeni]
VAEANGELESQQTKRIKFNELAKEWLAMKEKDVRPSTYKKIEERYKLHVYPYFKGMYLDELTPIKAQKFVNQLATKLVGYNDSLDIVNQIYKKAIQYGYVDKNPFENVDKPRAKKASSRDTVKFYDVEQLRRFLNSAYQLYSK